QFTFVFNINRCIACQTCSMADKSTWLFSKGQEYMWWNNVETKPYGGYPQFYDVKVAQLVEQVNPGGQVWNTRVGRKHHAPYGVSGGVSPEGHLQAAGGRDRADRPEPVPGVQEVRGAVSVQEADVPGHHQSQREVHCVLSPGGRQGPLDGGRADGDAVHGGVRGQDPAAGPQ